MAGKDFIGYQQLVDAALRGVVRQALSHVAKGGVMGAHHFLLTFDTRHPGVRLSEALRAAYPEEMTVVLQHQFSGLKVDEHGFEVTLSFKKVAETIAVPFAALRQFADPSQSFGFKFETAAPAKGGAVVVRQDAPPLAPSEAADAKPTAEAPPSTIVSLDKFRKK
jgi:hypothetical protein